MKIEAFGYTQGGKLHILNRKRLEAELSQCKDMDVTITIKKKGKRSLPQNAYYHGVVIPEIRNALRERGTRMDAEQVHEFLKFHFNKQYIHGEGGEVISEYGGSTTAMNKTEFGEYLDSIIAWAAEKLQLAIPLPGTQTDMFNLTAA